MPDADAGKANDVDVKWQAFAGPFPPEDLGELAEGDVDGSQEVHAGPSGIDPEKDVTAATAQAPRAMGDPALSGLQVSSRDVEGRIVLERGCHAVLDAVDEWEHGHNGP